MRRDKKPFDLIIKARIRWVLLFLSVFFFILLGRLFVLQIIEHEKYRAAALSQQKVLNKVATERGRILVRKKNGELIPLAMQRNLEILTASPQDVENPEEISRLVAKYFGVDVEDVRERLMKKNDPYEILVKDIQPEKAEKFSALRIKGLFFEKEYKRIYPYNTLAAHILGFVSKHKNTEEGKYGLEREYDEDLSGKQNFFKRVEGVSGFWIALGKRIINPSRNGADLVLTLDYNVQLKAEEVLDDIQKKWKGSLALVVVMDPMSGKILAMASRPVYDPNFYFKEDDFSVFLNPAVQYMYELGSVFKPITMAGALEEGLISPDSTYFDKGEVRIGKNVIRNFDLKSHQVQTMTQVLEKSLNTGAVYVARLLGKEKQKKYLRLFGFGQKTEIDLPGELAGDISNLDSGKEIDFAAASFGQGIAATPIQLATAFSAIANGGKLMKPYIVDTIVDASGGEFKKHPKVIRRVISKKTAEELTKMLVSAVRNGYENRAGVKGYFVAGKTGTAQIPKQDGSGYSDKVIHSFVGYAPAFNPKFLIYLQINEPVGNRFAANTLSPAFHDLAEYMLNYYEIPPDER